MWLPSGGSLIIERTEALTVIDVNTGKNVGTSNLEETVFRNNLEAAEEVARQLRLRDIGGIIVIDFIDMEIQDEPRRGRSRCSATRSPGTRPAPRCSTISELGLVEMTRKRISEGLVESFSSTCPDVRRPGLRPRRDLLAASRWPGESECRPSPVRVASTAMYAVIKTGGKQYRVERASASTSSASADDGDEVELAPGPARRRRHRAGHAGAARRRHR